MSSKPSVSSSGGRRSAIDAGTPVRSATVRPYSNRVIRRRGAGPGSLEQSGKMASFETWSPPQPAVASSAGRTRRAEHLLCILLMESIDRRPAAQVFVDGFRSEFADQAEGGEDDEAAQVHVTRDRIGAAVSGHG